MNPDCVFSIIPFPDADKLIEELVSEPNGLYLNLVS